MFYQQTAPRLAQLLGLPCLTFVQKMTLEGDVLTATRKLSDCIEQISVKGPAVVSVLSEINKPRIPRSSRYLGRPRNPTRKSRLPTSGLRHQLKPKAVRKSAKGFVMNRKNVIFKESDARERRQTRSQPRR